MPRLTKREQKVLKIIQDHYAEAKKGIRVKDIAKKMGYKRSSSASSPIGKLETYGLVAKIGSPRYRTIWPKEHAPDKPPLTLPKKRRNPGEKRGMSEEEKRKRLRDIVGFSEKLL